jgi:hypothetical protein
MADRPIHKHGRTVFFIEGEGFAPTEIVPPHVKSMLADSVVKAKEAAAMPVADPNRAFRFTRMFPNLPQFQPDDDHLIALGEAITDDTISAGAGDSLIPAGFTYLGQFIDHDITLDKTKDLPTGSLDPAMIESGRSPTLDLDSLYGRGPADPESKAMYEADGVRLKLGMTFPRDLFGSDVVNTSLPNDLPRHPADDPDRPKAAIIGDPRNDENLIVAQLHVAFLKFHNKVADHLAAAGTTADKLFAETRKTVIQHYQSIVLHDFLPRLVDQAVMDDVLANKRKSFHEKDLSAGVHPAMPVEFSVAAYRLGHSMVRSAYQWNMVFNSTGRARLEPPLNLFFEFTEVSGDLGAELGGPAPSTLPTDWIVDWRRMMDFSEQPGGIRHPQLTFARQIDTRLANGLQDLPQFANQQQTHLRSLATRNLLRGRLVGLPSGQDVAGALGVPSLTPAEIASGPHASLITTAGFDTATPLWFYILKEAEVRHGGDHLGAVGSRLVVETFHALVEGSVHSILKELGWKPTLPGATGEGYTLNELLLFVNDINPLGDGP